MCPLFWYKASKPGKRGSLNLVPRKLEIKSSPKLSKLVIHCENTWTDVRFNRVEIFFTVEKLASLGVTAIALPDVESLLSGASHFRPCPISILTSHLKISLQDVKAGKSDDLGCGHISGHLWWEAEHMFRDAHMSKGDIKELKGWTEIEYVT